MEHFTKNFTAAEFRCKCEICDRNEPHQMNHELLNKLQSLREAYGQPLTLTSAYRCDWHPNEIVKSTPGQHGKGTAVDVRVTSGAMAYNIMKLAFELGFTGIALGKGFVHLDVRTTTPTTWNY